MTEQAALDVMHENGEYDFITDYAKAVIALADADEAHKPELAEAYADLAYILSEYSSCKAVGRTVKITNNGGTWRLYVGSDGVKTQTAAEVANDWADDGSDW